MVVRCCLGRGWSREQTGLGVELIRRLILLDERAFKGWRKGDWIWVAGSISGPA